MTFCFHLGVVNCGWRPHECTQTCPSPRPWWVAVPQTNQVAELEVNNPDYTIPCFEKKLFSMITDEVRPRSKNK